MARPGTVLVASTLAFALVLLDTTVVNVALPAIRDDLGGGVSGLQWVVNGYALVLASLLLTMGSLADRIGARRMVIGGATLFAVASAAAALAPSLPALVAAQLALGVGASALLPGSLALLTHAYPHAGRRARAVGVWASGSAVVFAAGPVLAGLLIEAVGWRGIFAVNLPFAFAIIAITLRGIEETPRRVSRGLDLPGQITAIAALGALTFALIESGPLGWASAPVIGALVVAVTSGAAFIAIERRAATPMLPLSLFSSRTFSAAAAAGAFISFAMYGQLFFVSLYLQEIRGLSALETGLAYMPQPVLFALAGLPAGRLVARVGSRIPLAAGSAIAAAGALPLLVADAHTPFAVLWLGLILFGAGAGVAIPAMTTAVVGAVPPAQIGVASAALNASRQTGGVLGVALLGGLVTSGSFIDGMHLALGAVALALLAAAALGARHVEKRPRPALASAP